MSMNGRGIDKAVCVSDVSQGTGWWIASDDKWYPPELHPDVLVAVDAAAPLSYEAVSMPATDSVASPEAAVVRGPRGGPPLLVAVVALIGLVGFGVLALSGHSPGNSVIAGASPKQVIALTTGAAQDAGSVHVVSIIQQQGRSATYVNDTATDSGRQVITSGGAQVTVILVGETAYVNANQLALSTLFQGSAGVSRRFADKWLSFPSSGKDYKQIAQTLTLGSLLQQVTPTGTIVKLAPSVVDGRSVIGFRGELPGGLVGTLYVSATGSPLPVELVSNGSGAVTTSTFSAWGAPAKVVAPAGATPGIAAGWP